MYSHRHNIYNISMIQELNIYIFWINFKYWFGRTDRSDSMRERGHHLIRIIHNKSIIRHDELLFLHWKIIIQSSQFHSTFHSSFRKFVLLQYATISCGAWPEPFCLSIPCNESFELWATSTYHYTHSICDVPMCDMRHNRCVFLQKITILHKCIIAYSQRGMRSLTFRCDNNIIKSNIYEN